MRMKKGASGKRQNVESIIELLNLKLVAIELINRPLAGKFHFFFLLV